MLQQLLNIFTGAASTTALTYPGANGINAVNITPQLAFKKFFNNLVSSFSSTPQAIFGNSQSPGGINGIQGFQGQNQGQFPQNGFQPGLFQQNVVSRKNKFKNQALAPGSVVINPISGAQIPTQFNNGFVQPGQFIQQGQFPQQNQPAAFNPLQGFANQNGAQGISQGPLGQAAQFFPGQFAGAQGGGFGKLQLLLFPVIGVFTLFKSLFGLRTVMSSLQEVKVDKSDLDYKKYISAFEDYESEEGAFEEFAPEEVEGVGNPESIRNFSYE